MKIIDFTVNQRLGTGKGKCKPGIDFVLKRLQCSSENVFKIPSNQNAAIPNPPFQARFCRSLGLEYIYILASEEGNVLVLDSNENISTRLLKQWTAHDNAIFDVSWIGHEKVITASGDKTAVIWDVKCGQKLVTCQGHGCSLKSIALQPSSENIFATGSRDGSIMLWDIRCHTQNNISVPRFVIGEAHDGTSTQVTPKQKRRRISQSTRIINPLNSVTSVLFQDEHVLLSTGCSDRKIKGWDLRFLSTEKFDKIPVSPIEVNYPGACIRSHGYTSLVLNPNGSSFFANCTDSVIYQYTCSSRMPKLVSTYYGHKSSSFFVKMDMSFNGDYLLSGSTDCKAYIWKVSKPGSPILQLAGHEAEVTAVAWSPVEITKLLTCSDDENVLQWHIGNESTLKDTENGKSVAVGEAIPIISNTGVLCVNTSISTPKQSVECLLSPVTPTSSVTKTTMGSPSLMNWLTPKRSINLLTPPTTPASSSNATTPVKKPRLVLSDLSQKTNVSNAESFISMKKRLVNEQERMKAVESITSMIPRRALLLEEQKSTNDVKMDICKENVTVDRKSCGVSLPRVVKSKFSKGATKDHKVSNKVYSYGIKRFFSAVKEEVEK